MASQKEWALMLGNAFYKMKDARAKQDIESQKHAMEQMKVYADMLQSQSALKLNQQKIKDLNQKTKQRQRLATHLTGGGGSPAPPTMPQIQSQLGGRAAIPSLQTFTTSGDEGTAPISITRPTPQLSSAMSQVVGGSPPPVRQPQRRGQEDEAAKIRQKNTLLIRQNNINDPDNPIDPLAHNTVEAFDAKNLASRERKEERTGRMDIHKATFEKKQTIKSWKELNPIWGNFNKVYQSYLANPTGNLAAVDISLVMLFNKMLDPNSVVREGEFDRFMALVSQLRQLDYFNFLGSDGKGSSGAWDNLMNRIKSGGMKVRPEDRDSLYQIALGFKQIADKAARKTAVDHRRHLTEMDVYSSPAELDYITDYLVNYGGAETEGLVKKAAPPTREETLKEAETEQVTTTPEGTVAATEATEQVTTTPAGTVSKTTEQIAEEFLAPAIGPATPDAGTMTIPGDVPKRVISESLTEEEIGAPPAPVEAVKDIPADVPADTPGQIDLSRWVAIQSWQKGGGQLDIDLPVKTLEGEDFIIPKGSALGTIQLYQEAEGLPVMPVAVFTDANGRRRRVSLDTLERVLTPTDPSEERDISATAPTPAEKLRVPWELPEGTTRADAAVMASTSGRVPAETKPQMGLDEYHAVDTATQLQSVAPVMEVIQREVETGGMSTGQLTDLSTLIADPSGTRGVALQSQYPTVYEKLPRDPQALAMVRQNISNMIQRGYEEMSTTVSEREDELSQRQSAQLRDGVRWLDDIESKLAEGAITESEMAEMVYNLNNSYLEGLERSPNPSIAALPMGLMEPIMRDPLIRQTLIDRAQSVLADYTLRGKRIPSNLLSTVAESTQSTVPEWNLEGIRPIKPQIRTMNKIRPFDAMIQEISLKGGYIGSDPELVKAVIYNESGTAKNPAAVKSKDGSIGLMQPLVRYFGKNGAELKRLQARGFISPLVNPKTVDLQNPQTNLLIGMGYLNYLLDEFDNDVKWALAAYNWGPSRAKRARAGKLKLPASVKTYTDRVLGIYQSLKNSPSALTEGRDIGGGTLPRPREEEKPVIPLPPKSIDASILKFLGRPEAAGKLEQSIRSQNAGR